MKTRVKQSIWFDIVEAFTIQCAIGAVIVGVVIKVIEWGWF